MKKLLDLFNTNWGGTGFPSYMGICSIEGEGGEGDAGGGGAAPADDSSTAERALEFWDKQDSVQHGVNQDAAADGKGNQDGAGLQNVDGDQKAGEQHASDDAGGKKDDQQAAAQIPDEQLQADPRFQEVAQFRDQIQPVMDKFQIPDAKEMDLQLQDASVLYQIMQGKGSPSQLLDTMAQAGNWSKDQISSVATDMIGWLNKNGFLKDGAAQAGQDGAAQAGQDGKQAGFKDPLEERLNRLETERQQQGEQQKQQAEQQRQTKIFSDFRSKVSELCKAAGMEEGDVDFYGREIRAQIPADQFAAVVGRIEKGNYVDVQKFFTQIHNREVARLKRFNDSQLKSATARAKGAPRLPAGGAPPAPAGQQKRNLGTRDGRLAAAEAEWDK